MRTAGIVVALLLLSISAIAIPQTAQVSGNIIDRTGKPLANAQVVYTNEDSGRVYKFKTNKKGEFLGLGVAYGVYKVEVTAPDGTNVYTARTRVQDPSDPSFALLENNLKIDLSTISITDLPGIKANTNPGNLSQHQKEMVRSNNANIEKMNGLINQLHTALDAKKWPDASDILKQMIAIDPNRWEFYQNLGTVQTDQSQYEEAAETYGRGIQVAQSGVTTGSQPSKKDISLMMIYAGDDYTRTGNVDKAVEFYSKAAGLSVDPATAYFNMCRAQRANGNADAAIEACNKAIAADPNRWEFYQTLGGLRQNAGQNQSAIEAYDSGITAAEKSIAADPDSSQPKVGKGQMLSAEGNIYLSVKKYDQAIAAFKQAAVFAAYPAREYFNICAAYYDIDGMEAAVDACDQAITSDPRMADAYFVKASALLGKSKVEKGMLKAPPGTADALNKYLELDPQGEHAADVRALLDKIGSAVDTTYKSHR